MAKTPSRLRRLVAKLNPFRWLPRTYRLQRQLKRVDRDYRARIAAAKAAKKNQQELHTLEISWSMDARDIIDELESLRTGRLTADAYRLGVPIPPSPPEFNTGNEWWEHGSFGPFLTTAGINKLRGDVRAEKQARREAWSYWLTWIGALTGLLGALAAVLALRK